MTPLNSFIEKNMPTVEHYFDTLVKVDDPEDHLQVNKYMELTQKTKPVILISLHEISMTHRMLLQNLDALATEKDDPLKLILNDLGDPPPMGKDDREIQLTLANRFKVDVEGTFPSCARKNEQKTPGEGGRGGGRGRKIHTNYSVIQRKMRLNACTQRRKSSLFLSSVLSLSRVRFTACTSRYAYSSSKEDERKEKRKGMLLIFIL